MTDRPGPRTERVRTRRMHQRGAYDRATIDAILDAQPLAHVGYLLDGAPLVTPTLQWREGDHVYWHGSSASRMLERCDGAEVCVTVTLMDGMVMARSAYNHSVNYRSVMLLGRARIVDEREEKRARLRAMVEHMFPGRWDRLRPMTEP
ncbi:MAG: pyridoxamine 5'-phosphate oxidase family protein, partial [Alphaproteobacteria bacterium]